MNQNDNIMKFQEIQDLIKLVSRSSVTEVEIERKDFKLVIRSEGKPKKKGSEAEQTVMQAAIPMGIPQMPMPAMQPVQQQPVAQPAAAEVSAANEAPPKDEKEDKYITINSPMIGTFYRSPAPDKEPYVGVGDTIKPGSVICIIEAMKLFNEIESEVSGTIVKVLVDDASPVEYDQPLFLVDPS